MRDVVIVEAVRTPIGRRGGALSEIRADELLATVLRAATTRARIEPALVEDVIAGCVTQVGEQGANVARVGTLLAGFPVEVAATSVNRQCGSSHQAIHFAAQAIRSGDAEVVIAAGVESMSRVPLGSDYGEWHPQLLERYDLVHQGAAAEMLVDRYGLTRDECDRYSLDSHCRAAVATDEARFAREILPITGRGGTTVAVDEGNVAKWAQDRRVPFTTFTDLSQSPEIRKLIAGEVEAVNSTLSPPEQVKKFSLLPKRLYPEDGEVTPTMKVKRKAIMEKFTDVIAQLYQD